MNTNIEYIRRPDLHNRIILHCLNCDMQKIFEAFENQKQAKWVNEHQDCQVPKPNGRKI